MIVRPLLEPWRLGAMSAAAITLLVLPTQNPATVPSSRMAEAWWRIRHEERVQLTAASKADVVFLGDSITEGWEKEGKAVWDREIAPLNAANFGFSGDGTSHVLWRLRNGEVFAMHPKVVVLLNGTTNVGRGGSPEDTVEGITTVLDEITEKLPDTRVLLLGVFPRGWTADDEYWQGVAQTDEMLERGNYGDRVRFLDIGDAFINDDGTLSKEMFPDSVHPSELGYEAWATAMTPTLREMLSR